MKSSYIDRAIKFIDSVYPYIKDNMTNYKLFRIIEDYNKAHKRNIIVCGGAIRFVLVTSDYAIKWDRGENAEYGNNMAEWEMYSLACREGYDYLLAACTSIIYHGIRFNIMPRYNINIKNKPNYDGLLNYEELDWVNSHIDDLHENNYTVVNGRIVIIDYACKV